VSVPVPLVGNGEYTIGYVTKSLFDCDTNMIEYAIISPNNWRNNFYIYREDGTLLFQRDSTLAPWCLGCYSAAYDIRPIVNTVSGAKMFLAKANNLGFFLTVDVYTLCGELPENPNGIQEQQFSPVKVFPNPTKDEIKFQFDFPGNILPYSLILYSSDLKVVNRIKLNPDMNNYLLDVSHMSSGIYFFSLHSDTKEIQNGKFVVTK
jgi:hypothetical protein